MGEDPRPEGSGAADAAAGALSRLLVELARTPEVDSSSAPSLQPGQRVGRYQIRREIGRGGFGTVYEAVDPELGRAVALKTLRPGRSRQDLSEDWIKQEAEAIARLDHPSIVTVHDVGRWDAGAYLVEELLRGGTLSERIAKGALPQEEALRIAEEMARGLAHAHHRGVLHRDLKPANVFLTDDGRVKLLDFGLAHLLGREGSSGGGTPAYMAPEQARGEAVDERADVYAAAVVLAEMLTGRRPAGASAGTSPPHPPAAPGLDGLPRPLGHVVKAGLAADTGGRPRDGGAWLAELRSARLRMERPRRARRVAALAGVGLVLGLLVAGLATWRVWRRQVPVGRLTVAVADFANETRDPELDGLSGLLSAALEQSPRLRVLTRSRMWDYARELGKGDATSIDETLARAIGRKADARALLLASVRRLGGIFVVEMRALDPERDEYLFTVREKAEDKASVLDLVDRLSERTRVALREPRREVEDRKVPVGTAVTGSLEAHAHYYRAQQVMAESLDSDAARAEYLRALEIDPAFPQPHLQLAVLMTLGEAEGDEAEIERHVAAVRRAGDRIPERDRRLAGVLLAVRASEEADPAGKERARAIVRDAVAADPDSKELLALAGQHAVADDQPALAAERLEAALRIDPGYGPALVWLATVYENLGRRSDAVAAARRAVAARPGPVSQAVLAQALAVQGEREAALAEARKVVATGAGVPYLVADMVWPVLAYGGDRRAAETVLRRWAAPGELPARQVSARSALSFLLSAQGRAREVRALGQEMRGGMAPELSWWATAMAEMLEGRVPAAVRAFREAGVPSAAPVVAYLGDLGAAAAMARALPAGSPEAEIHRAVDAWRRGDPATAVPVLRGLIARTDDGGANRFLGEILCEGDGRPEGAERLARWLERYPSAVNLGRFLHRPRVMLQLARCQEAMGRGDAARATLDGFLSEWSGADAGLPMLAEARAARARLAAAGTAAK